MKKYVYLGFLGLGLSCASFFFGRLNLVQADTVVYGSQVINTDTYTSSGNTTIQPIEPTTNQSTGTMWLALYIANTSGSTPYALNIGRTRSGGGAVDGCQYVYDSNFVLIVDNASGTLPNGYSGVLYCRFFAGNYWTNTGTGDGLRTGSGAPNAITYGSNSAGVPYYVMYGTTDPLPTPAVFPSSISFDFPLASSTDNTDFTAWRLNFTDFYSSSTDLLFIVRYGTSPINLNISDQQYFTTVQGQAIYQLPKARPLSTSTTFYAQVQVFDSRGFINDLVAESPVISFSRSTSTQVVDTGQSYIGNSTSTESFIDCSLSNLSGCFIKAGTSLGNFFFRPSVQSQNYLSNQVAIFKTVFPFSVYFNFTSSTVSGITNVTSTGNYTLHATLPVLANNDLVFLSSSTLVNLVGQTQKDAIFAVENGILWLGTLGLMIFTVMR